MEKILIGFFALIFVGIIFLMVNFEQEGTAIRNACSEAGGIAVFGDRGHFKVCLDPDAVIELPSR